MKKILHRSGGGTPKLKKLVLIMKLNFFIMLIAILQVSASVSAQKTRLDLKMKDASFTEILDAIERQSEVYFFYNKDQIDENQKIDVDFQGKTVDEILNTLKSDLGITYELVGKNIIIKPTNDNNLGFSMQNGPVSGKVTDSSGQALPGVTVVVKGTTNGTITNFDGVYILTSVPENGYIQFSFVGMKSQEIAVGGQSTINVRMEEEAIGLDEIVAIGYGVQKKSDVTGALTSVSAEDIASRPVKNAVEAMQGKAAGVDITSNERPGTVGNITIRGVRSLTASNSPLYVVDGIPLVTGTVEAAGVSSNKVTLGGIDNLNPNDIESIDILKDASATAIYGSRGANGVVLITTKQGKAGKFTMNFDSSVTTENIHEYSPLFNAGDYVEYRRWAEYYAYPTVYPRGDQPTQATDVKMFTGDETAWNNIPKAGQAVPGMARNLQLLTGPIL